MEVFEKAIEVRKEHLDELNHVNNVVFLQWVQDISKEHWLSKTDEEINSKMYWVVRSHHLDYKRQVFLGDRITAKTYVVGYKGPFSERVVEFYQKAELAVATKSNWCLIDRKSQKPLRVAEELKSLF